MDAKFISVLDHGHVGLIDHMGGDLAISRAARVSYDAEPREEDGKLIRYLMINRHTTPFEAVEFTFDVKAPIFVFRQWHRHRTWSYNELSARYKELPEEYYIPNREQVGTQSQDNKQMRDVGGELPRDPDIFCEALEQHSQEGFRQYRIALSSGIPRELARCFLGLNVYSHMFGSVDLHNLFHFIRLRIHEHSQYEIRVYAEAMLELIEPIVPFAVAAFKETLGGEEQAGS